MAFNSTILLGICPKDTLARNKIDVGTSCELCCPFPKQEMRSMPAVAIGRSASAFAHLGAMQRERAMNGRDLWGLLIRFKKGTDSVYYLLLLCTHR